MRYLSFEVTYPIICSAVLMFCLESENRSARSVKLNSIIQFLNENDRRWLLFLLQPHTHAVIFHAIPYVPWILFPVIQIYLLAFLC